MHQLVSDQVSKTPIVQPPADVSWSRIARALRQRARLIVMTFCIVFGAIVTYTMFVPRTYTTHVKLIAGGGSGNVSSGDAASGQANSTVPLLNALLAATGMQSADTYAELFQEEPVADRVISDLHLNMSSGAFLSHVKVRPIANTPLLELTVTAKSAEQSAKMANAFAEAFIDRERQLVADQADRAIAVLNKQIPAATAKAATTQNTLTAFQTRTNLADVQTQTQTTIAAATQLDTKVAAAEVDRQQAKAQFANVSAQMATVAASIGGATSVAPNPVMDSLRTQLSQATVQLQLAEQQYTAEHPSVIALKRQVAEVTHQIHVTPPTVVSLANTVPNPLYQQLSQQRATLESQIAADGAALSALSRERGELAPQISALPAQAARFLELQRQAKLAGDVLAALQQKLNNAQISKSTALSDVTITQPADARSALVYPNRVLNVMIGLLVSAALALLVGLLVYLFDRRIRTPQQIEEELELSVLASVPTLIALGGNQLKLTGAGEPTAPVPEPGGEDDAWRRAHAVEAFLELVTAIRYSTSSDRRMRCITVTSASQGDGKSTIAMNMAMAMAYVEPRVLLIDGDLRRPTLHSKLNRELNRGLSDVLVGRASLEEAITRTEHEGLDLMTSGTRTSNSVKLLQSSTFDATLERLLERYQMIVIDAPAVAPVVDAAILAAKADGTVVVVSMNDSDAPRVRDAVMKLQSFGVRTILGTVANRARIDKRDLHDDYFYTMTNSDAPIALSG